MNFPDLGLSTVLSVLSYILYFLYYLLGMTIDLLRVMNQLAYFMDFPDKSYTCQRPPLFLDTGIILRKIQEKWSISMDINDQRKTSPDFYGVR